MIGAQDVVEDLAEGVRDRGGDSHEYNHLPVDRSAQ